MKQIDILTIFPDLITPYLQGSIMKRAQNAGAVGFGVHDIRTYADDKHNRIDDTPYGGGAGMVMQVAPIYHAVKDVQKKNDSKKQRIILLSAKGAQYTQRDAERLMEYDNLIFICGRYEGVDERVAEYIADEELAIGEYVLTGGELGALVIVDSVVRLLPEVLGNEESTVFESHSADGYKEHPQYTKPEEFNSWRVPKVLLSGHHGNIEKWRKEQSKNIHDSEEKKSSDSLE